MFVKTMELMQGLTLFQKDITNPCHFKLGRNYGPASLKTSVSQ